MVEGAPTVSYQQGLLRPMQSAPCSGRAGIYRRTSVPDRPIRAFLGIRAGSPPEVLLDQLGDHFAGDDDIAYKPYPNLQAQYFGAALAIELANGHSIRAEDIGRIDIAMNQQIFDLVCAPADQKGDQALRLKPVSVWLTPLQSD